MVFCDVLPYTDGARRKLSVMFVMFVNSVMSVKSVMFVISVMFVKSVI